MPRPSKESIRRAALVKATIAEVGKTGSLGVTVSQISANAGVSSALAHHYFGSKEAMFLATMRHIMSRFRTDVRVFMRGLTDPRARSEAILKASFSKTNFEPNVISAWLNFYVHAQISPDAQQLLRIYQRRLQSNLTHELRPLAGDHAPQIARGLGAIIDGLYIREALRDAPPDPARSVKIATDYLAMSLREFAPH